MRLSILNFFSSPHEAIELAQLCDTLGYHRFWVGEHHSKAQIPDALTFAIIAAGTTERIRIGTGAVSLVFRNPHLVAESAITAELFFPGRIDLGVTKAAAVDRETLERLVESSDYKMLLERYPARLRALRDALLRVDPSPQLFLRETIPVGPPMFVMVTNAERAREAAQMGVGIVVSFHHGGTTDGIRAAVAGYREHFQPSPLCPQPCAIAVVSGFISDDERTLSAAIAAEQTLRAEAAGLFQRTITVNASADRGAAQIR